MYMSKREQKSCSWISKKLKPALIVLTKASSNFSDRPLFAVSSWETDSSEVFAESRLLAKG
jgi:hypothetical protein